MTRRRARLALCLGVLSLACAARAGQFDSGRASFAVAIDQDLIVPYRVFAVFVLPGESLELSVPVAAKAYAEGGQLVGASPGQWRWMAPAEPGFAQLGFAYGESEIRLNMLVLHPASGVREGKLYDYRIGEYPEPLNGDPVYAAPDGFVELTEGLIDFEVSPHFKLGQFPSKQSTAYPKYQILSEDLLIKLELLLERLNEAGIAADSFTVMSGYRTPVYNHAIGNGQHSRHIYGGAADIYVDVAPRDDVMDDLDGDGIHDYRDAQWLYRLADELFGRPELSTLRGGLGVYDSTAAHGPFLHVDARGGRAARWGLLP